MLRAARKGIVPRLAAMTAASRAERLAVVVASSKWILGHQREERLKELFPPDGQPPSEMPVAVRNEIIEGGKESAAWYDWYGTVPADRARLTGSPLSRNLDAPALPDRNGW